MSQVINYQRFWQRRGTDAEWAAANPVLHAGEIGVVQDPGGSPSIITRIKIGDGIRAWLALPWFGIGALEDLGYDAVPFWDTVNNRYELRGTLPAAVGGTGFSNYNVGDILYASAAAVLSRLAAGTLAYVLTSAGPGQPPYWAAVPGGGGGYTNLGTTTLGSAASGISSGTIDLSSYKAILLILKLKAATASPSNVSLTYNADTTATNYDRQRVVFDGASVSAARANDAIVGVLPASGYMNLDSLIVADLQGKARARTMSEEGATTTLVMRFGAHHYRTAVNVTGVTILSSVSNNFNTGSELTLWGLT